MQFPDPGEWLQIGIHLNSTNELVGDLALHTLEEPGRFEVGFTLAPQHQGRGFALEATRLLVSRLFDEQNALCVLADTDSRNTASIALLTKLGFVLHPEKSWQEEFKGETVTVNHYELERAFVASQTA